MVAKKQKGTSIATKCLLIGIAACVVATGFLLFEPALHLWKLIASNTFSYGNNGAYLGQNNIANTEEWMKTGLGSGTFGSTTAAAAFFSAATAVTAFFTAFGCKVFGWGERPHARVRAEGMKERGEMDTKRTTQRSNYD